MKVYSVKCSSFFHYTAVSILPQKQITCQYLIKTDFLEGNRLTSKLVSNNYLEEIWDAICTISNIERGITGASLNF